MRPGFLHTCLMSFYFLITSAASPRDQYREGPDVVQNVNPDLSKEPTCDELRAMWRFSKRQSRASESTNEIPTYRDPFAYNVWEDHASIRSVGGGKMRRPLVYGRVVHSVVPRPRIQEASPERIRAFEEVARLFGTSMHMPKVHNRRKPTSIRLVGGRDGMYSPAGSFQHLKELIQSERSRELHEQKVAEENAARESALRYQRMMFNEREREREHERERERERERVRETEREREGDRDRERAKEREGERDDVDYKSWSRISPQQTGDDQVNYPVVLTPSSKYDNDLYSNYNYMQRTYPDPLCFRSELDRCSQHDGQKYILSLKCDQSA